MSQVLSDDRYSRTCHVTHVPVTFLTCLPFPSHTVILVPQMYPAWAFSMPAALLRLPFSLLDATIFTAIMYFPTGLAPQASRFFIFWGFHILFSQVCLCVYACHMMCDI